MTSIITPSFTLATYQQGDEAAERVALVLPGRLDTKEYLHMKSHVNFLAKLGYFAISFDPPGTWESSGHIDDYTMTNYLIAINELITLLGNRPTVLMGHSRGGSMAMLGGVTNAHVTHIISAMAHAAPSSMPFGMKPGDVQISMRDIPGNSKMQKQFKLPYHFFEDAARYDVLSGLRKCVKPKLFIFGEKDSVVTPEDVQEIYNASAYPKQLLGLDVDHNYRWHPKIIEQVNTAIGEFIKESA